MIAPTDSWYLKYICFPPVQKEDMFYSSYGIMMHDILDKFYSGRITNDEAVIEFLSGFQKVRECYGKPKHDTVTKYLHDGKAVLRSLKPLPYKRIISEDTIDFKIGDLKFTSRIDYLGECGGGFALVDHKSRKLKPRSNRSKKTLNDIEIDNMFRQLYLYSEAIRQKYGEFPKKLCFNCFMNGTFIEEDFNKDKFDETIQWVNEKYNEILEDDTFHPEIEFFSCNCICEVGRSCCYKGNGGGK